MIALPPRPCSGCRGGYDCVTALLPRVVLPKVSFTCNRGGHCDTRGRWFPTASPRITCEIKILVFRLSLPWLRHPRGDVCD
jgi:hypothetical protein